MSIGDQSREQLGINAIRVLAMDAVQKANSGHPGLPMGAAPMAYVLWQRHLRHNPRDPHWPDRDRFVLSAGHGSMLLYCLLYLSGYDLGLDDLRAFRQWGSRTPGHPETLLTAGIEATTGPLGQGTANAVGMAMAERALAHRFNRPGHTIVDHRTYAIVSDGVAEGLRRARAAASCGSGAFLRLIVTATVDARLDREDVGARYEAYAGGSCIADGTTRRHGALAAEGATRRGVADRQWTTIGYSAPKLEGVQAHGARSEEVTAARLALGWSWPAFEIPEPVLAFGARSSAESVPKRVKAVRGLHARSGARGRVAPRPHRGARWMGSPLPGKRVLDVRLPAVLCARGGYRS